MNSSEVELTISDIQLWTSQNLVNQSKAEQLQLECFQTLLNYYSFKDICSEAVNELNQVIKQESSLEHASVKNWILKYEDLGRVKLFGFFFEYLDYGEDPNCSLYIAPLKLYVDRKPFLPIIQFWELHYLLYGGDYHLSVEKRTIPDTESYYYVSDNKDAPSDFEKVIALLNMNFSLV